MQQISAKFNLRAPLAKRALSIGALLLFLFLHVLASSHEAHELWHGHSTDSSGHQCAATLLSKGAVEVSTPHTIVAPSDRVIGFLSVPSETVVVAADYRLSPSRAPPSFQA